MAIEIIKALGELRSLYDVTGDVKDINTVLLSRAEYQALQPVPVDAQGPIESSTEHRTLEPTSKWYAAGYHPDHIHPVWNGCKVRPSDSGICRTRQAKIYP